MSESMQPVPAILLSPTRRVLIAVSPERPAPLEPLRAAGFEPIVSATAAEALQHLGGSTIIALVGDAAMLLGGGLLEWVRDERRGTYTYVILLAEESGAGTHQLLEAGADDIIPPGAGHEVVLARLRVAERIAAMQADIHSKNVQLENLAARMRGDLEAAARVQRVLLPSDQVRAPGVAVAWRFRPSEQLAGDILNCFRLDERHLAFYVLDVSGHGVSAALLSVQVARLMSPMMSDSELLKQRLDRAPWYRLVEPVEVMSHLNGMFQTHGATTHYFTMIYGMLEMETRRVRFTCAGHPGPVRVMPGSPPRSLSCPGLPVGLMPESRLEQREIVMEPGERLWLYSDGLSEVTDQRERMLGEEGLLDLMATTRGRPLDDAAGEILAAVERWSRPGSPGDDCSLLALEALD